MRMETKTVKAYMVIDQEKPAIGSLMEQDADCSCRAYFHDSAAIFFKKKEAIGYANYKQKVIPAEITYTLPTNKQ